MVFNTHSWEDLIILLLVIVLFLSTAGYFIQRGFRGNDSVFQITSHPIEREDEVVIKREEEKKEIVVHLSGAVHRPGVYYLQEGDRVVDLLKRGGGAMIDGDLNRLNLAAPLHDGQKIHVPKKGTDVVEDGGASVAVGSTGDTSVININTSSQAQLENLPGVGPSRALAIIEYRSEEGPFTAKEELMNVSGIGEKTFASLKDLISIY